MAPNVAPQVERLIDGYLPVKPASIDAEFDRIWDEAGTSPYDTSSVRLRLSTIVAWTTSPDAEARFERVMAELARTHPCRGILAATDAGVRSLESAISAHCWRTAAGGRHTCAEEILLRAGPASASELASAVLALLVPEVPVYLWLMDEPSQSLPEELVAASSRIFYDSALSADGVAGQPAFRRLTGHSPITATDFAWVRSRSWRELAAQLFDGNEAELEDARRIRIVGGGVSISAAAELLAGWFTSRLRLTPASRAVTAERVEATFYDGTRGVDLVIEKSDHGEELEAVHVQSSRSSFTIELHQESGHLHVRGEGVSPQIHRVVGREAWDEVLVLLAAIDGEDDTSVYREAVGAILATYEV